MEENKKINTEIVVMVVIVIVLILSLLGMLLYAVNENNKISGTTSNNRTTSSTTTVSTTTTTKKVNIDEEAVVKDVFNKYLLDLENKNKISDFKFEVSLLTEEDYCPGNEYSPNKIYAGIEVTYKRIDESFVMTGNDDNANIGNSDLFKAEAVYIISLIDGEYQIENLYTGC